ncbi:hypothetical protein FRB96_004782 [Tulasnella sp. 330]|nr:hypothetical protein FRB96_004782 [Tulasnella sp. 330]KAG8871998.1 hypothetical protein FRB97_008111 [Tulasnella sp. 331]
MQTVTSLALGFCLGSALPIDCSEPNRPGLAAKKECVAPQPLSIALCFYMQTLKALRKSKFTARLARKDLTPGPAMKKDIV